MYNAVIWRIYYYLELNEIWACLKDPGWYSSKNSEVQTRSEPSIGCTAKSKSEFWCHSFKIVSILWSRVSLKFRLILAVPGAVCCWAVRFFFHIIRFRGHSTTTWTEFCHFWPPPTLREQFLYRGQKQTFFDPLPPSSCPRSYWMPPYIALELSSVGPKAEVLRP